MSQWVVLYEPPDDPPGVSTLPGMRRDHMLVEAASAQDAVNAALRLIPHWGDPGIGDALPKLWAVPLDALTPVKVQRIYTTVVG